MHGDKYRWKLTSLYTASADMADTLIHCMCGVNKDCLCAMRGWILLSSIHLLVSSVVFVNSYSSQFDFML